MAQKSSFERKSLPNGQDRGENIVFDTRRARTAWFEGQHVTAEHFNRDQSYLITRAADLGRSIGSGIVDGFGVTSERASQLTITAGLGLSPNGDTLHLSQEVQFDLADIPTQRRLNATLYGGEETKLRPETRTGLYVLSATLVEHSSNPIASYPVSITADRSLQDSVINEALLFTLTPAPVPVTSLEPDNWRALAAYQIFVQDVVPELPSGALGLAMVALEGNKVVWVDTPMIARALSAQTTATVGLGLVDERKSHAHFNQFDAVVDAALASPDGVGIPASDLVLALPAMGRLPAASVAKRKDVGGPVRLSQNWLPAAVPTELVALPEDEIDALLRESVHMPPIDLTAKDTVLANTPVTIIVPVPRADWMQTPAEIREAALSLQAPPAVGGSPSSPQDLLDALLGNTEVVTPEDTLATDAWVRLLADRTDLWYMRRRQFLRSDMALDGVIIPVIEAPDGGDEPVVIPTPRVNLAPVIEHARAPLSRVYSQLGRQDVEELLFLEPDDTQLRALIHQSQLLMQTAVSSMMGAALMIGAEARNVEEAIKAFDPFLVQDFRQMEHAIYGQDVRMRISSGTNTDGAEFERWLSRLFEVDESHISSLLKRSNAIELDTPDLADPDFLNSTLKSAAQLDLKIAFDSAGSMSEGFSKNYLVMAESQALSDVLKLSQGLRLAQWASALPEMRNLFAQNLQGPNLGGKMVDILEGVQ